MTLLYTGAPRNFAAVAEHLTLSVHWMRCEICLQKADCELHYDRWICRVGHESEVS